MTTATQKRQQTVTNVALVWFLGTALLGLLTGLVQSHLLRPHMGRAWRWAVASAGGWIVGLLLTVGVLYALGFISQPGRKGKVS